MKVFLFGGLANQLFQIQYGLSMRQNGCSVTFDDFYVSTTKNHGFHVKNLLDVGSFESHGIRVFGISIPWMFARVLLKLRSDFLCKWLCLSNDFFSSPKSKIAFGYFQQAKYRNSSMAKSLYDSIFSGCDFGSFEFSAMHVRLGDYVNNSIYSDISGYYVDVARRLSNCRLPIFVVSDDALGAKRILQDLDIDLIFCEGTALEDLSRLYYAQNLAIANSSFSFLPALYGHASKIYAPSKWFNGNMRNQTIEVPKTWEMVE